MASKTSHWAHLSPNARVAEKEGMDMSEWRTSLIVRTPVKGSEFERVQIFIGDTCTWDSDWHTEVKFKPGMFGINPFFT